MNKVICPYCGHENADYGNCEKCRAYIPQQKDEKPPVKEKELKKHGT